MERDVRCGSSGKHQQPAPQCAELCRVLNSALKHERHLPPALAVARCPLLAVVTTCPVAAVSTCPTAANATGADDKR